MALVIKMRLPRGADDDRVHQSDHELVQAHSLRLLVIVEHQRERLPRSGPREELREEELGGSPAGPQLEPAATAPLRLCDRVTGRQQVG